MIAQHASTVVMPTWVFVVVFVGGFVWNAYLMWANSEAKRDVRREARRRQSAERQLWEQRDAQGARTSMLRGGTVPGQRQAGEFS